MGFSGGGSNVLLPHTHDGTVSQDGGPLNFANITQAQLNLGDTTYSDGVHLQQLPIGNAADVMTVSGGLPAWVPAGAPAASAWTILGSTTLGAPATTMSVLWNAPDVKDFLQIYVWTGNGGGTIRRYLSFSTDGITFDHGNNYATQFSSNFGAPSTSLSNLGIVGYDNASEFDTISVCCPDTAQSKLVIRHALVNSSNSAAIAPTNRQLFGKWANTTDEIRGCEIWDGGAGGLFAAGSGMLVLGTDL